MSNPLESLTLAAGSEALPLELLQPLDSNNPASTPVPLGGPEQHGGGRPVKRLRSLKRPEPDPS